MKRASLGLVALVLAFAAGADDVAVTEPAATAAVADRCDAIVATISDYYSESFDKIVARKVPRASFSTAIALEMRRRFEESGMQVYGRLWDEHFAAVGDQLAPELIEGYVHYQCRTDTQSVPIESASDPIDAACWNVAHDGKMEILDARMAKRDATDLRRLSRAKILACITTSLVAQPAR